MKICLDYTIFFILIFVSKVTLWFPLEHNIGHVYPACTKTVSQFLNWVHIPCFFQFDMSTSQDSKGLIQCTQRQLSHLGLIWHLGQDMDLVWILLGKEKGTWDLLVHVLPLKMSQDYQDISADKLWSEQSRLCKINEWIFLYAYTYVFHSYT